jgi:hypothetical protein
MSTGPDPWLAGSLLLLFTELPRTRQAVENSLYYARFHPRSGTKYAVLGLSEPDLWSVSVQRRHDAKYKVIVVVFTDLSADRAQGVFDDVLQHLGVPSYAEDGIVFGAFYEGHEGTAIYNSSFRPFRSPVPFLFVRHGVISDWKFFLDNEDWLNLWARRLEHPQSTLLLRNYAACRGAPAVTGRCPRPARRR